MIVVAALIIEVLWVVTELPIMGTILAYLMGLVSILYYLVATFRIANYITLPKKIVMSIDMGDRYATSGVFSLGTFLLYINGYELLSMWVLPWLFMFFVASLLHHLVKREIISIEESDD